MTKQTRERKGEKRSRKPRDEEQQQSNHSHEKLSPAPLIKAPPALQVPQCGTSKQMMKKTLTLGLRRGTITYLFTLLHMVRHNRE